MDEAPRIHQMPLEVRSKKACWLRLAAACIIMISIGFIYGWSIFSVPLSQEFGWESSTLSFAFTVLMWCFCAGGFLGARLSRATSARFTIRCSAALILLSFTITALGASKETPFLLYATYGVLGGLGVGMSYTTTMATTLSWFPHKAGLASGVMLLCYSMSTMILGSFATWLFDLMNWRYAFAIIASAIFAIVTILASIMREPAETELHAAKTRETVMVQRADSLQHDAKAQSAETPKNKQAQDAPTKIMLKSGLFWAYACWMLIICSIGLGITGSNNQMMRETGATVQTAVALVGLFSLCNGFGRLAMGMLFDAIGTAKTMALASLTNIAGCSLILAAIGNASFPLALAGAGIAGAGIGGTSVIGSGFANAAFGARHYAQNLSVLNLILIPAAFIGPAIVSASVESTGSYGLSLEVFALLGLLCTALSFAVGVLFARHTDRSRHTR